MNSSALRSLILVLATLAAGQAAIAHELRPAFLDVRQTAPETFSITWKVPARGERRLGLYVRLPDECTSEGEPVGTFHDLAFFERWTARCTGGLKGREISIDGLRATLTDGLARIQHLDGGAQTVRVTPEAPSFVVSGSGTGIELARTYFLLGAEHILTGLDHLLFVFALILLIRDRWMLIKTITAFTVAHSITLAFSALGYISLPQTPVEAVIALSIAFVASELVKSDTGDARLSRLSPWIVAFAFGLLHGFGFAGALKEIGLPQSDIPLALLLFNLGVEAGQLLFVGAVLVLFNAATALFSTPPILGRLAAGYVIGSIAATWLIFKVSGF